MGWAEKPALGYGRDAHPTRLVIYLLEVPKLYLPLNDQFSAQRKNRLAVSLYQSVTAFLAVGSKIENHLITCLIIAAIRIKIFNYLSKNLNHQLILP